MWKNTKPLSVVPLSLTPEEVSQNVKTKYITLSNQSYCTSKFIRHWRKASNGGSVWES
jgi:hypothetical protein